MSSSAASSSGVATSHPAGPAGRLRIELFPHSLAVSLDFYTRVMRFTLHRNDGSTVPAPAPAPSSASTGDDSGGAGAGGYAHLSRGSILLGLSPSKPEHYLPIAQPLAERYALRDRPLGTELVLELPDDTALEAERAHILENGWALDADLQKRPWGLWDFRVRDPDGWYWRFTTESVEARGDEGA